MGKEGIKERAKCADFTLESLNVVVRIRDEKLAQFA